MKFYPPTLKHLVMQVAKFYTLNLTTTFWHCKKKSHYFWTGVYYAVHQLLHDDVIKWKHFPRNWPFVRGIHPVPGEFPAQRPVTRGFDVFFGLPPNKRLSKQWWGWWFGTLSSPFWRHCNGMLSSDVCCQKAYSWYATFVQAFALGF